MTLLPPPPPPQMSEAPTLALSNSHVMRTPPQRTRKHSHNQQYSKSPASSPATSASSLSSPSHVAKTRMTAELMSPRVRSRMDPYPRYSPRKRLSTDYSDGTYSVGSGGESPRSEKGGWRIHAAVAGPFLTGPLAREFRAEDFKSPRGKKTVSEPDFDNNLGLLLFPVVPAFMPPAISPEVFQAAMQPSPQATVKAAAPPMEVAEPYYPPQEQHQTESYEQQQQQVFQEEYHQHFYPAEQYQEQYQHQDYTAEQYQNHQQQYTAEQYAEYYGSYEQHYGYEQQQYDQSTAQAYGYEGQYEQSTTEHPPLFDAVNDEASFPPLPQQHTEMQSNQPVEALVETPVEIAPVRRERAPSYADVVTGAAQSPQKDTSSPKKLSSSQLFEDMSTGIAESMSSMLTKAKTGKTTHSEVEFACVIHKISTQLKLMGKVSSSLKMEQMKALHKLQKVEAEKLSVEASNMQLAALLKQYEQEREELKQQLAQALETKETGLKDAVLSLTQKMDSMKHSKLASEIEAIRNSESSGDDLKKRVQEIGQVLDHLIASHNSTAPSISQEKIVRRPSNNGGRRGSWKSVAMYAILVLAASLCGVFVGVKYVDPQTQSTSTAQPLSLSDTDVEVIMARLSAKFPSIQTNHREIAEAVAEVSASLVDTAAAVDFVAPATVQEPIDVPPVEVVEVAILDDASISVVETVSAPVTVVEEVRVEAEPVNEVTPERVAAPISSAFSHVLYSGLFEMPTSSQDASALNGLARALTSLSSQILAEQQASVNEPRVFEEIEEPVEEAVADGTTALVTEAQVDDVSGSVIGLADVAADVVVEAVEVLEAPVVEEVPANVSTPYSWELTTELPLVFEEVLVVEAPREEVIAEATAEVVVEQVEEEVSVPVVESVEAPREEVIAEATAEVVVEQVEEEVSVPVVESVVESVAEWVLPVPVQSAVKPVTQFSNASEIVVTSEIVDGSCLVPVVDLRSL